MLSWLKTIINGKSNVKISENRDKRQAVRDDIVASYLEDVDKILALISEGEIANAVAAFERLYMQYGGKQTWLNYNCFEFVRLADRYRKLGDWKESCDTLESALLTVRGPNGEPHDGTVEFLFALGSIKRFFLRNAEAVPLLEEAVRLRHLSPIDIQINEEHMVGLAKSALADSNEPIALAYSWNTYRDGTLFTDKDNIVDLSELDRLKS